jgi:hypothetical protein
LLPFPLDPLTPSRDHPVHFGPPSFAPPFRLVELHSTPQFLYSAIIQ